MNQLFILAFDHRKSLLKNFDREELPEWKKIIYEGFKLAVGDGGVPKDEAAILVDEEFGTDILLDAKSHGYQICLPVEKSGVEEFEFEYGDSWPTHIEKFKPDFVKALVRGLTSNEVRPHSKLEELNNYCRLHNYQFLLEIPQDSFEQTIDYLQKAGIKPDIWKLPGFDTAEEYQRVIRKVSKMIILGRGEDQRTVEKWLMVGRKVDGVIGFAIGRTIFMPPLLEIKDGKIDRKRAAEKIAKNYQHFYDVFNA